MPEIGEAGPGHEPHITGTDHRYPHDKDLFSQRSAVAVAAFPLVPDRDQVRFRHVRHQGFEARLVPPTELAACLARIADERIDFGWRKTTVRPTQANAFSINSRTAWPSPVAYGIAIPQEQFLLQPIFDRSDA